jgi:hypothetical protein
MAAVDTKKEMITNHFDENRIDPAPSVLQSASASDSRVNVEPQLYT